MVQAVGVQCVEFPVDPDETASGISHLCGMSQSAAHSGCLPELGAITPERASPASFPGTCTSDDSHSQEGPVELPPAFQVYLVRLEQTGASPSEAAKAAEQDAAAAESVRSAGRGGVPGPVQVRAEAAARSPHARRSDMLTSGAARAPAGSRRRGARGAAAGPRAARPGAPSAGERGRGGRASERQVGVRGRLPPAPAAPVFGHMAAGRRGGSAPGGRGSAVLPQPPTFPETRNILHGRNK